MEGAGDQVSPVSQTPGRKCSNFCVQNETIDKQIVFIDMVTSTNIYNYPRKQTVDDLLCVSIYMLSTCFFSLKPTCHVHFGNPSNYLQACMPINPDLIQAYKIRVVL